MSEYPPFSNLNISTMTIMAYSNISFKAKDIFENIRIDKVDPANIILKGKKRIIDSSDDVVSIQTKTRVRGVNLRKVYKYHCPKCLKYNKKNKPVNTVIEHYKKQKETDELSPYWECKDCGQSFTLAEVKTKTIDHFLNQVTIVTTLNTNIINVMVFKDNLKIVGCKSIDDAIAVTKNLWKNYISPLTDCYTLKEERASFIFEPVMANVGFKIGFPIDRKNLNVIMNEASDEVFMAHFEPTTQVYVSIKMITEQPDGYKFHSITFDNGEFIDEMTNDIPYKKVKPPKDNFNTFIVFKVSELTSCFNYYKSFYFFYFS